MYIGGGPPASTWHVWRGATRPIHFLPPRNTRRYVSPAPRGPALIFARACNGLDRPVVDSVQPPSLPRDARPACLQSVLVSSQVHCPASDPGSTAASGIVVGPASDGGCIRRFGTSG